MNVVIVIYGKQKFLFSCDVADVRQILKKFLTHPISLCSLLTCGLFVSLLLNAQIV